jgi:hypothetical protein
MLFATVAQERQKVPRWGYRIMAVWMRRGFTVACGLSGNRGGFWAVSLYAQGGADRTLA